jgi:hypothetical protein
MRRSEGYEMVANIDHDKPHLEFSVMGSGKFRIPKRFIAQNVVEILTLENKKELTIGLIGDDHYKLVPKKDGEAQSHWVDSSKQNARGFHTVEDILKQGTVTKLTLGDVEYFKRDNVGGKTRWFKACKPEELEPHDVTCVAHDVEFSARKYVLQDLLVKMDNTLRLHTEYLRRAQANLNLNPYALIYS